jgi:hypothetical protein
MNLEEPAFVVVYVSALLVLLMAISACSLLTA